MRLLLLQEDDEMLMMGIRSSYIFIVSKHNTESNSFHDVEDDNGNNMLNSWCGDAGMHGEFGRKK